MNNPPIEKGRVFHACNRFQTVLRCADLGVFRNFSGNRITDPAIWMLAGKFGSITVEDGGYCVHPAGELLHRHGALYFILPINHTACTQTPCRIRRQGEIYSLGRSPS